jgi:uncharacterized protein (AIM24 family)
MFGWGDLRCGVRGEGFAKMQCQGRGDYLITVSRDEGFAKMQCQGRGDYLITVSRDEGFAKMQCQGRGDYLITVSRGLLRCNVKGEGIT